MERLFLVHPNIVRDVIVRDCAGVSEDAKDEVLYYAFTQTVRSLCEYTVDAPYPLKIVNGTDMRSLYVICDQLRTLGGKGFWYHDDPTGRVNGVYRFSDANTASLFRLRFI